MTLELGPEGGSFEGFTPTDQDNSFDEFYQLTGLDPEEWPLDQGSLRVSMWQQSKRTEDGDRDVVWLKSYKGNLRRTSRPELTTSEVSALLEQAKENAKATKAKRKSHGTRVIVLSDLQIGKVDRLGGTEELLERMGRLTHQLCQLPPTKNLILVDAGDLVEGFENTSAQQFTNDLSHPEMLRVARGVLLDVITSLAPLYTSVTVATCPSNHGAWRRGKGSLGRPGDDYGLDVHYSVRDVLSRDKAFKHVTWAFPESEWDDTTYLEAEGHTIAVTHGHHARSGQFSKWWQGQAGSSSQAHKASVIISGHYHTFIAQCIGTTTEGKERLHYQAPPLDGGSSWWKNYAGEESRPGVGSFLLNPDGWSQLGLLN